ncbi:MAG: hypothetical protein U1F15_10220 [Burkholderiales bacterium]
MTLDTRTRALVDLVEADRARRCDAILGEARERAAAARATAHAEARERMRVAFEEERHRYAQRAAAAHARLQTHRRLREQRLASAFVASGLAKLPQALVQRWQQRDSRAAWVARALAEARRALPAGAWTIVHAPGWPADERDALLASLAQDPGAAPTFMADDALRAGLKISAGGNVVDGTLAGLVADRAEIGAALLQLLEAAG